LLLCCLIFAHLSHTDLIYAHPTDIGLIYAHPTDTGLIYAHPTDTGLIPPGTFGVDPPRYNSVHSQLFTLPPTCVVYPAHDYKVLPLPSLALNPLASSVIYSAGLRFASALFKCICATIITPRTECTSFCWYMP